ncbi:MAG: hypothetical protein V4858_09895 [Pseudomonadota bacterium]
MKHYLDSSRLNVAPGAPKHLPLAWVMLAAGVLVFGASLYPLTHELQRLAEAKSAQAALTKSMRREVTEQRKLQAEQNNSAAMEREKIRAQIHETVHMSWDGIFNALEVAADAVHAGVSIISLAPTRVTGTATQLNIAALAANMPIMLAYIEALKKDPRVSQVEMSTQQPDEKVGPAVIRFRISVVLNPKIEVPRAVREPASAAQPSIPASASPVPGKSK